jgi:hypothetical protein
MGMYDFIGTPGDNGIILGGYYLNPQGRRFLCMSDHATKGIWLTDPDAEASTSREEDERIGGNWYGTREEFDAYGWTYTGEFDEASKAS